MKGTRDEAVARSGDLRSVGMTRGRRVLRLLAVAGGLLAGWSGVAAQVVNFRHYTSAEGLPQAQVLGLHQDRLGYIWFGNHGGLSRFNGAEFLTYTKEDGLTSNSVFDVTEDERGRLLIASSGGFCVFEDGDFRCWRESDGLVHDNARSVAADGAGGAWVGTSRGLSHVRADGIRNYTLEHGLPAERVMRVAVDSGGRVWAATERGLARLEGQRFVLDSPPAIRNEAVQFIKPAGAGLLAGTADALFLRQDEKWTAVAGGAIPRDMEIVDGAVDRDGTIWVATRAGALRIRNDQVQRLSVGNGLLTDMVNRVSIDREGNVWFGTESGASKHVPGPFRTYTVAEGLPNAFVRAIAVDAEGRLWTGTRDGVAVRDGERFRRIDLPGVPDTRVFSLLHEPSGGLLIGTRRGLIWRRNGRVTVYLRDDGLPGEVVYSLVRDGLGGIWIGTDRGLARWEAGRVTPVDRPGLSDISIMSMARDDRGRLWLGRFDGGIGILDDDSLTFLDAEQGGTDQSIWALAQDASGAMWAGTNGDGALRIDTNGIRRFTMKDGLASNFVWQVLPDSHGDIWLFGNHGLDRLSGDRLTHYGRGSGLIELEGSANAACEDKDGTLWFGTGSGIVRYSPGLDVAPWIAPPVYIEEATLDGATLQLEQVEPGLKFKRGAVHVRFASPSFRDESSTRFRYRLVGTSDGWSSPTAERGIRYAGLAPGRYRFEVLASNGGLQSPDPASLVFTVLPAFWQTLWFQLFGAALLVCAAVTVPVLRARALGQERRRLEALVAQRTAEIAEKNARLERSNRDLEHFAYVASHDLQEPLRKIQAFSDRVGTRYGDRLDDQGRDYLERTVSAAARMQGLIDALLSLSRVATRTHEPEPIELRALVQEVTADLEFRMQSTGGRVELGPLPRIHGDSVQMRQVFQNLIGNALKFHRPGEPPVVRVSADDRGGTVEIRVEDNGIGFDCKHADRLFMPFQRLHSRAQYEGTGIGLTICQKIVERHGGTIRAESTPGVGSRFLVTLPIHRRTGERHAA